MSDDLLARCAEQRAEEIAVVESIYPDQITVHPNPTSRPGTLCTLTIPITLAKETNIALLPTLVPGGAGPSSLTHSANLTVSHLPPISLRLVLPDTYPIQSPPRPIGIKAVIPGNDAVSGWLSRRALRAVQEKIGHMWQEDRDAGGDIAEGSGVLWRWCEWVGSGEFLEDYQDGIRLAVPPSVSSTTFHTAFKTYNAQQIHSSFEATAFSCTICFESRKGKRCVQMPCDCVFCHDCLSSCWTLAITEGTLESVSCPSPACVKRRATAAAPAGPVELSADVTGETTPEITEMGAALVESVVGRDLAVRWQDLKNRRRAEIDPTYCICPREQCQAPVPPPPEPSLSDIASSASISSRAIRLSDLSSSSSASSPNPAPTPALITQEDRWARYRQCPTCTYSFCLYCSSTWHGPHTPCAFPQTASIVREYLSFPEGSPERARIEQRRGKKNIERMVQHALEDAENKAWLDARTRACAGCGVRVEKSHGCNHMTCGRCGAHFCYRCGGSIKPSDPYAHYRTPGSSCFEKLFDQEEIARFERETAMQQAGIGFGGVEFGQEGLVGDEWGPRGVWEW